LTSFFECLLPLAVVVSGLLMIVAAEVEVEVVPDVREASLKERQFF